MSITNFYKNLKSGSLAFCQVSGLCAAILLTCGLPVHAQDETTITQRANSSSVATSETGKLNLDEEHTTPTKKDVSTQTVVLIGEKVSLNMDAPRKPPFPDLQKLADEILGGTISDFTTPTLTIAQTAELVKAAKKSKTDIAIVFAGFSDETENIDDEDQAKSLDELIVALKKNNPKIRIFLVPAATTVGTLTNANLMLAADVPNVAFVPLGTEVGGEPYRTAFQEISSALEDPMEKEKSAEATQASKAITIQGKNIRTGTAPEQTEDYMTEKADLQKELQRIAGQAGTSDQGIQIKETTGSGYTLRTPVNQTSATMTYPEGGTLTKHGPEAVESIEMRPLPAVKAYRPQAPVPRNNTDKKEPALSR